MRDARTFHFEFPTKVKDDVTLDDISRLIDSIGVLETDVEPAHFASHGAVLSTHAWNQEGNGKAPSLEICKRTKYIYIDYITPPC